MHHCLQGTQSGHRQLDLEALVAAVRALEALAHERTVTRLKQESHDVGYETANEESFILPFDPVSIFLLEAMVSITCQTPQHIEDIWSVLLPLICTVTLRDNPRPVVFEHLSALISTPTQYSILLIERAVVGLLRICLILAQRVCRQIYNWLHSIELRNSLHSVIKFTFLLTF